MATCCEQDSARRMNYGPFWRGLAAYNYRVPAGRIGVEAIRMAIITHRPSRSYPDTRISRHQEKQSPGKNVRDVPFCVLSSTDPPDYRMYVLRHPYWHLYHSASR
jgi:hypothetical protein